ncbi:MAG: hypothetical protein JNG88_00540 [Phycisphaerales bacterium]|nr:hypothetical protein [Phycisphaerales bacterium]
MPDASDPGLTAILPQSISWEGQDHSTALAAIPNRPAVFLLVSGDGVAIQLGITQQLRVAVQARLQEAASARRADLGAVARGVRFVEARDAIETRYLHWRAARLVHPEHYREQLAFGPADFLSIDLAAEIPEFRVTQHPYQGSAELIGPFPTRSAAQAALEGLWDLFDLCRYPEQVRRAPCGTRCAYADMGRCDAPCDGSAPASDYIARTRAAWEFARGGIDGWIAKADDRMREEASARRFERAALIKQQTDFAQRWKREWRFAKPVRHGAFLCVTRVVRRAGWTAYLFHDREMLASATLREREAAAGFSSWALAQQQQRSSAGALRSATSKETQEANELAGLLGYVLYGGLSERYGVFWVDSDVDVGDLAHQIGKRIHQLRGEPEPPGESR